MDKCITSANHICRQNPDADMFHMHTHAVHEILYLISGDTDYAVEGNIYRLRRGDIMIMRRHEAHCLKLRSPATYERITINFDPNVLIKMGISESLFAPFEDRPLGTFNHYSAMLFQNSRYKYYLEKICELENEPLRQINYLLPLLDGLLDDFKKVKAQSIKPHTGRGSEIIAYITDHLYEPLSLDDICATVNMSKSQLNRVFRSVTGSTVWKYITVKRLYKAKELLSGGISPTEVYLKCGFNDYITFYRAYKKQFGLSPKDDSPKRNKI